MIFYALWTNRNNTGTPPRRDNTPPGSSFALSCWCCGVGVRCGAFCGLFVGLWTWRCAAALPSYLKRIFTDFFKESETEHRPSEVLRFVCKLSTSKTSHSKPRQIAPARTTPPGTVQSHQHIENTSDFITHFQANFSDFPGLVLFPPAWHCAALLRCAIEKINTNPYSINRQQKRDSNITLFVFDTNGTATGRIGTYIFLHLTAAGGELVKPLIFSALLIFCWFFGENWSCKKPVKRRKPHKHRLF